MLRPGTQFVAQQIVDRLAELGQTVPDLSALDAVLERMAKAGEITVVDGEPAWTRHGIREGM
jgi:hypothetical protein